MTNTTSPAESIGAPSGAASFYRWEVAGKPIAILFSLELMDRMEREVLESFKAVTKRGSEIGGVLGGRVIAGSQPTVIIEQFEAVECDYSRGPLYLLSDDDKVRMRQAFDRVRGASSVTGFFRSNTRRELVLDEDDQALAKEFFSDPNYVFLLVRPFAMKPSAGGFFFWENGQLPEASHLQFPFKRAELEKNFAQFIVAAPEPPVVREPLVMPKRDERPAPSPVALKREEPIPPSPPPAALRREEPRREAPAPPPPVFKREEPRRETPAPPPPVFKREEPRRETPAPPPPVFKREEPRRETPAPPPPVFKREERPSGPTLISRREEQRPPLPVTPKREERPPAPAVTARREERPPVVVRREEKPAPPPVVAKREEAAPPKPEEKPIVVKAAEAVIVAPPKKEEPVKVESVKVVEPVKVEPPKAEPAKAAPPKAQPVVAAPPPAPVERRSPAAEAEQASGSGLFARLKWAIVLILVLAAAGGYYFFVRQRGPAAGPAQLAETSLGLKVENSAGQLLLSWNRNAPIVVAASRATLTINDGDHKEDVDLDLATLRTGSIVYSPISNDVMFRLEAFDQKTGKSQADQVRRLTGRPSPSVVATNNTPAPVEAAKAPANQKQQTAPAQPAPAAPAPEPPAPQVVASQAVTAKPVAADTLGARLRRAEPAEISAAPALDSQPSTIAENVPNVPTANPIAPPPPSPARQVQPPPAAATQRSNPAPAPAPVAAAKQGGQAQEAKVIKAFPAAYPTIAKTSHITGIVRVHAVIGKNGKVKKATAMSGPQVLRPAAVESVMRWIYSPAILDGEPVDTETQVDVRFQM